MKVRRGKRSRVEGERLIQKRPFEPSRSAGAAQQSGHSDVEPPAREAVGTRHRLSRCSRHEQTAINRNTGSNGTSQTRRQKDGAELPSVISMLVTRGVEGVSGGDFLFFKESMGMILARMGHSSLSAVEASTVKVRTRKPIRKWAVCRSQDFGEPYRLAREPPGEPLNAGNIYRRPVSEDGPWIGVRRIPGSSLQTPSFAHH